MEGGKMKILICGIGAAGSNLVNSLVPDLKGEHEITVLDKDKVEERNVTAGTQLYTTDQIGLYKTEALQFNIFKRYEREINILTQDIFDTEFLQLSDYSLVVDCFDNFRARNRLQAFATGPGAPEDGGNDVLHVGFSDQFTFAIEWHSNYKAPTDITTGIDICEMPGAAAFVNIVGSLGSLVVQEWVNAMETKKYDNLYMEILGGKFEHRIVK